MRPSSFFIILLALLFTGCSSGYYDLFREESSKRLNVSSEDRIVTEQDMIHLPELVRRYLRFTGSVGKPMLRNLHVVFDGGMKRKVDADWMDIAAQQYGFFDEKARFFYIRSSMFGIPFDGLHAYTGDSAVMKIKAAGIFQIADARGDTMTRSETVTLFNDMCLLAPATLIDPSIIWGSSDSLTVQAQFTNTKYTISATLYFDSTGALVDFSSDDRYLSEDGSSYQRYRWTTPVRSYMDIGGRKVVEYAEAVWHLPGGPFPYARFTTTQIDYNCTIFH